ncbi:hypothetical protein [Aeromicrobium sp. UC242_57]|uniref:hypothetical protein n=1 Tax=Aeromicrobium sp. UC242_57 TaxID=3374624 RepID=UPI00379EE998
MRLDRAEVRHLGDLQPRRLLPAAARRVREGQPQGRDDPGREIGVDPFPTVKLCGASDEDNTSSTRS